MSQTYASALDTCVCTGQCHAMVPVDAGNNLGLFKNHSGAV